MLLEINGSNLSLFRSWITGHSEQFKVRGNSQTVLSAFKRSIFIGDEVDRGNFFSYYVLCEIENHF